MNSSDYWDQSSFDRGRTQHEVQVQGEIPPDELLDSIASANALARDMEDLGVLAADRRILTHSMASGDGAHDDTDSSHLHASDAAPSLEQIQRVYYARGLGELESMQLLDLSPLANWKLLLAKPEFGLAQLREDLPDLFWQSDGSNGNYGGANADMPGDDAAAGGGGGGGGGATGGGGSGVNVGGGADINTGAAGNELTHPHTVTVQFAKRVAVERLLLFTNYSIDESYTPSKIQILAGSLEADLSEVCVVSFNKPIGWLHIIFNGIRADAVLKCFVLRLVVLSNHQDGKDTHIRLIKVFGRKQAPRSVPAEAPFLSAESGVAAWENVNEVVGMGQGFQSVELRLVASIR